MSLSTVWTRRKVLTTIALGLMSLVVGKQAESEQVKPDEASVPALVPPLFGDPLAPVRFCLWGNYTCGYTAQLFPILLNIALENRGKVSIEWHHFPQRRFDPALHVASLGFIATNRFWFFTRDFLGIMSKGGISDPEGLAMNIAKYYGISEDTIRASLADQKKWEIVKNDFLTGKLLGIKGPPALFYNGYFLTPDGVPEDLPAFEKSLRDMVQKA